MKTLNLIFIIATCLMAISRVSGTFYIVKTFENYGKKSTEGAEGHLTADGEKRVECFAGLVGNKINQPDHIYYKGDGTDKQGNVKVNPRKFTAEALAAKFGGIPVDAISKEEQLSNLLERTHADGSQNSVFVWSDQDKAKEVANALGAASTPAEFNKDNYGGIWILEGSQLTEATMDCPGLSNIKTSGSLANIRFSVMSLAVAVIASLYFFF
ncbi:hypothetical protein BCR36DRAFT_403794 [Piromyces finnis]|uniref:Uncharacterized protein n=1 Tax=Piromyces finnis TaxID=1754191 RepID=A0A1Y1VCD7_9FUNG|nr:hypothetical protein BCR36DRAFT_403794 [Piromyces finnis]|eukprot:ORX52536.1 hypothetical protein BCR36DRAFT_403794 [Piromyces finnis]